MDTPRTNLGDATYLGRPPPDFDMTQEPSFHSPSKDNNLLQQMRNGRPVNLRTPRGSRAPLGDKRNLPAGLGGSEFTPMLKSATRNSIRKRGKENTNGLTTPALGKIDEDMDMTNVPVESSLFGPSRNMSYADATALPEVDASSTTSTPVVLPTRRGGNSGPLQDGNQLSLREQENVIDKIEKENFALKLKIHFLEEALRKTGPGFSEAALKENTDLKIDKVTMQRELSKHKKQLASAEKDLETYQQQILDIQERAKKKYADQSQKAENDALRQRLEDREAEIEDLQRQAQRQSQDNSELDKLRDEIGDLEADLRAKEREVNEREDELDELNTKFEEMEERSKTAEAEIKDLQQQLRQSQDDDQVNQLRGKISTLEASLRTRDEDVKEREDEIDELETKLEAMEERWKAIEAENEDLQRQLRQNSQEDGQASQLYSKISDLEASLRLRDQEANKQEDEIDDLKTKLADMEADLRSKDQEVNEREDEIDELNAKLEGMEGKQKTTEAEIEELQRQLQQHSLDYGRVNQLQVNQLHEKIGNLEANLRAKDQELDEREDELDELKTKFEGVEADLRAKGQEINEREDELDELQAKLERVETNLRAKNREINDREDEMDGLKIKLERSEEKLKTAEKRVVELEVNGQSREELAEAKQTIKVLEANIRRLQQQLDARKDELQQAIDAEGTLSNKEKKLRDTLNSETERHRSEEAVLTRQIEGLKRDLEARQSALTSLRSTLDAEAERHKSDEAALNRQIDSLKRELEARQSALASPRNALSRETERHRKEEATLNHQIDSLKRDLEARQSTLTSLRNTLDSETERHKSDEASLNRQIDSLKRELETRQFALASPRNALTRETERHKNEEAALSRQIDVLKRDLESQQSTLISLRNEISTLQDDLQQSDIDRQEQAEKIEALEDEVEVLQATLDEESEDASQRLREADKLCQDLRRQLERSKREQLSRADRLGQLEDADHVAENLRQQLEDIKKQLDDTEQERNDLQRKVDNASHQQSTEVRQANQATEDLKRQLQRAQRESKKAKLLCEELRSQLDTARQDLDYANPLCKELRQKLDRARSERATYQASAEKLQVDCERLKKGAQEALAWIQAKNAEKQSSVAPGPIKKAAMATFRYGDVVMDVVDQKDHEAVIRAADSAQRRHEKEIRGMVLQIEWMQARWERESKLRNDGAFAKKYLQLRLDIADACNKADLRILNRIHQDLGLKSTSELLAKRQKTQKPRNKLKVFVAVIRAVARMRIDARKWGQHEKTRQRLVAAWEEQKQKQKEIIC
ncbi:hypothetical protein GQX73_g1518 [Xylaria multiplex]|uniref:Centrosomin N-terminal motif 1 domain-containing protein n=1 Tax=Xylaria multiplex TaxID=323545 RepID=A0A7C8J6K5_9PEZI|nr:hypothetical protein GQX73_g1518 [Xylaria multiplex]